MIMNLANILKILPSTLKLGEVAAIAANNGYQSQTSRMLGGLSQATNLVNSVVPDSGTANAANATTPSPKPVAPKGDPGGIKKGISPGGIKKGIGPAPDAQSKELLKVKSTIPKASNPNDQANITKGYLEGLKQSGAKLDNKGQIVKQSGQAFRTEGWDRKAQLMGGRRTPDRLHRLRLLAIDKAANAKGVKAATTEIGSNIPQTKDQAEVRKKKGDGWLDPFAGKSEKEIEEEIRTWGFR